MNFKELEERAEKEVKDIKPHLEKIEKIRKEHPYGCDMFIPESDIPAVTRYCDDNLIPFYPITESCCSTAATYSYLVTYERRR